MLPLRFVCKTSISALYTPAHLHPPLGVLPDLQLLAAVEQVEQLAAIDLVAAVGSGGQGKD